MAKALVKIISTLIFVLLALALALFLKSHPVNWGMIKDISLSAVLLLFLLNIFNTLACGIKTKILLKKFGVALSFREWFGLSCINAFGNYITPFRGGTSLKAVYLKKVHKVDFNRTITLMGSTFIISFLASGLMGLLINLLTNPSGENSSVLTIIFSALIIGSLLVMFFPKISFNFRKKPFSYISKMLSDWHEIRKDMKMILKLLIVEAVAVISIALRYFIVFSALGVNPTFLFCITAAALSQVSIVLVLTPAALGIKEGAIVLVSKIWGYGAEIGLYGAAIDRIISIIWVFVSGLVYTPVLIKKANKE